MKNQTNLQALMKSVDRADRENLKVLRSPDGFAVINHEGDSAYTVVTNDRGVVGCNCPHSVYRGVVCKHMVKVSLLKGLDVVGIQVG